MSDFRQCKWCGQIYQYTGSAFCGNCVRELDKDFTLIKELLYKQPGLTIPEVVEQTGVEEKIVFYLLKEGRLEMTAATTVLRCESCGQPIRTGRLCAKCKEQLSTVLEKAKVKKNVQSTEESPDGSRLRHTYIDKKKF